MTKPKPGSGWMPVDGLKGAESRRPSSGATIQNLPADSRGRVESVVQSVSEKLSALSKVQPKRYQPK